MKHKKFVKQLMGNGLPRNISNIAAKAVQCANAKYSDTLAALLELREWKPYSIGSYDGWKLAVLLASENIITGRPLEEMPPMNVTITQRGGGHE